MVQGSLALNWRRIPERYRLKGNRCDKCGTHYFPGRTICPNCRRAGNMLEEPMPREGKIISYTKVSVAPMGFENETPYYLALIELANGVKILSQIASSDEEKIDIGAKVEKVFRKILDNDHSGVISYGYKFKVK